MRRALLVCAAITFAIACTDNFTEPVPDRPAVTPGAARANPTVAFATTTTEDGLSISTDKDDYQPGDVVHLTGYGWPANDVLDIVLTDDPLTHEPHVWTVQVSEAGTFQDDTYVVDKGDLDVTFTLVATSRATGQSLTVVFTDGSLQITDASPSPFSPNQASSATIKDALTITIQNVVPPNPTTENNVTVTIRDGLNSNGTLRRTLSAGNFTANQIKSVVWDGKDANGGFVSSGEYTARTNDNNGSNQRRTVVVDNLNPSVAVNTIAGGTRNALMTITGTAADLPAVLGAGLEKIDVTILRASDNAVLASGSATNTGTNFSTWSFSYTPNEASNQKARAKATDNAGNNTTATDVAFTVVTDNRAPTAVAGGPYTADEGSATLLDGSGSSDPDAGNTLTYLWSIDFTTTSGDFVGIDAGGECKFFDPAVPADPGSATSTLQKPNIKCTDDGIFKLTLVVTDNHSASSAPAVTKLTVNNVVPTATALNTNSPVNEGTDITLSLAGAADVSSNDFGALQYAFDCGSGYGAFSTTNSAICSTTDNGTRTVRGKVKDDDTGVSTDYSASVTINNVAPTATFSSPASVEEGTAIALSLTSPIDPSTADGSAGFHYAFDCGAGYDGAVSYATAGTSNTKDCPTTDDASLTVKGTIFDKDGGSSEYTASVTVDNAAPVVKSGPDQAGDEGQQFQLAGSFEDPGTGDTHEWTWEYAEGFHGPATCTFYDASTLSPKIKCNDDGVVYVTLTVTDDDGGEGSDKLKLTLANVAPSATGLNANTPVDEGSSINLSLAAVTDPSSIDLASLHYAFECGTGDDLSGATYATAGTTNSATCPTTDNGTRVVKGKVFDKDAGVSSEYSATVTIVNVPPTAVFNTPTSVSEGSEIALSLTNGDDVSSVDKAAGFTYAFDCGDGAGYGAFGSSDSRSCPTTDNGTRNVNGKIQDKDGGVTEYSGTVQVINVPPTILTWTKLDGTALPSSAIIGGDLAFKVTFADLGTGDTHKAQVDCGLGYADVNGAGDDASPFQASCPLPSIGSKTFKVKVTDDDGGFDEETHTITVKYNFAGFSAPVDRPNTYNVSKAGQAIPLKWRLTDANGNGIADLTSVSIHAVGLSCSQGTTQDLLEEYAAGSSGLQNLGNGYYQFNWKTPTGYAGSCKSIALVFGAGGLSYVEGPHAYFTFKK